MKKRVCHISTVHPPFDIRIFHKECKSLLEAGYSVSLIVQHEKDDVVDGINILALPKPKDRKERIFRLGKIALRKAISINADLYHFHDPELIPLGLRLKMLGKKVIYDVHEDVPRQILSKAYLNRFIRPIISKLFEIYENFAVKKFDALIAATPNIRNRFLRLNRNTIDINNFPILNELYEPVSWNNRRNDICYIGNISKIRGIIELIKALENVNTTLHLAGNFESKELEKEVKSLKGWKKVKYYGFINRQQVRKILSKVKVGIVTLHPEPNHINSQPNKLFEYMSAGIPVIASDFPLWKEIVEGNNCGLCVNPLNSKEIANALKYILSNDKLACNMGINARKAIEEKYNWERESKKLLEIYKEVLYR